VEFRFELLGKHGCDIDQFRCEKASRERYLRVSATHDVGKRLAVVFLLVETATNRIAGYFALSTVMKLFRPMKSVRADFEALS